MFNYRYFLCQTIFLTAILAASAAQADFETSEPSRPAYPVYPTYPTYPQPPYTAGDPCQLRYEEGYRAGYWEGYRAAQAQQPPEPSHQCCGQRR